MPSVNANFFGSWAQLLLLFLAALQFLIIAFAAYRATRIVGQLSQNMEFFTQAYRDRTPMFDRLDTDVREMMAVLRARTVLFEQLQAEVRALREEVRGTR